MSVSCQNQKLHLSRGASEYKINLLSSKYSINIMQELHDLKIIYFRGQGPGSLRADS